VLLELVFPGGSLGTKQGIRGALAHPDSLYAVQTVHDRAGVYRERVIGTEAGGQVR
jgi:hypothetical protein